MNRKIKLLLCTILSMIVTSYSKVLFIVDSEYYNHRIIVANPGHFPPFKITYPGKDKVDRYKTDVETIDGKNVEIVLIDVLPTNSYTSRERCKPVWEAIESRFVSAYGTNDPVEGAVLIGDIPEPMMMTTRDLITQFFKSDAISDHLWLGYKDYNGIMHPFIKEDTKNGAFHYSLSNDYYPNDFVYMDVWDEKLNMRYPIEFSDLWLNKNAYITWTYNDWSTEDVMCPYYEIYKKEIINDNFTGNYIRIYNNLISASEEYAGLFSTIKGCYNGDGLEDIWVSRIYAKTLKHIKRIPGSYSGIENDLFYDNYSILSNYLDRLHYKMTKASTVPYRALVTGTASGALESPLENNIENNIENLKRNFAYDKMNFNTTNFLLLEDKNAWNWQAQLQAGPYGNINYGAFKGEKLPFLKDCRNSKYLNDTRGFQFAFLYEHSGAIGHGFDGLHNVLNIGTSFNSVQNYGAWKTGNSTLNNGSYSYYKNNDLIHVDGGNWGQWKQFPNAEFFSKVNIGDGIYNIYLYYDHTANDYFPEISNLSIVRMNLFIGEKESSTYKYKYEEFSQAVDRSDDIGGSKWHCVLKNVQLKDGDPIKLSLLSSEKDPNGIVLMDAIKLVNMSNGNEQIIENDPSTFLTSTESQRAFTSMIDDGGISKVNYYVLLACRISDYTFEDNLGLSYAMAHNGLISIGTSTSAAHNANMSLIAKELAAGKSFGNAYLSFVRSKTNNHLYRFYQLLGAGTISPYRYKKYVNGESLHMQNELIDYNMEDNFYNNNVNISSNVIIKANGKLNITAGREIIINPEFHAKAGSELNLCIDNSLIE